jgi:Ca-activated chloride channel family protein
MLPDQFHFAQSVWFWGLLVIPVILVLYWLLYMYNARLALLDRFADPHLLPHLLKQGHRRGKLIRLPLFLGAMAWICGIIAMAGPRWNYTDVQAFEAEQDVVILLDLSSSMNAQDIKPSRMARARQEIEDFLNMSEGKSVGLVAFAAVPHMVSPLTDDTATLRNLLPELDPSLVTLKGDRLKPAIEMAARMLSSEAGNSKSILIISNGNFDEGDIAGLVRAGGGAAIYTMGIGTAEGAPVPDEKGDWLKDDTGKIQLSRLQADKLQALASAGHGSYFTADYTDNDTRSILSRMQGAIVQETKGKVTRMWEERFYIPAFFLALLILPLFRRGYAFPIILFFVLTGSSLSASASSLSDFFLNQGQQGQILYDKGDYKGAMQAFDTPYRRGIAAYKAGQYDQAAKSFSQVQDPKVKLSAQYNLGNAQMMQNQPERAISNYESVLKQDPTHTGAKHNLEIAKKLLQEQNQQQQQQQQQQNQSGHQDQQKQDNTGQSAQNKTQGNQQSQQNGKENSQAQAGNSQSQQSSGKPQEQNQNSSQEQKQENTSAQKDQKENQETQQSAVSLQNQNKSGQVSAPDQQSLQTKTEKTKSSPGQEKPDSAANRQETKDQSKGVRVSSQKDIDADQWLNRVQNDPGSFLRNQFMIEDRLSGQQQEANP